MIYCIQLKGKEYDFKEISNFSFDEYSELNSILNIKDNTTEQYRLLITLFTELTYEQTAEIDNLFAVDFKRIIGEPLKTRTVPLEFKGNKLIDLEQINIGRFIDMEYFLLQPGCKIETIVSFMYMPKEYSLELLRATEKDVCIDMCISTAIQVFNLFISFRLRVYTDYDGLFELTEIEQDEEEPQLPEGEEDDEQPQVEIGFMSYVYLLANDRILDVDAILDMKIFEVLNYLGWKKRQADRMEAERKAARDRNGH